ncbi:MAG TPA: ferritin-like domain-containing protein [Solirubrobacteraceae bacterium]|jgi:rubrerythrin
MITRRSLLLAQTSAQSGDAGVLALLLAVEHAQVALYEHAAGLPFHGRVAELAGRFGDEERKHADRLGKLGARGSESAPPVFDFDSESKFLRLAQRLEGLAVGAYNGAIPLLADPGLKRATAAIVQVEARHSAAVRVLRRSEPAPRAFDRAFEPARAERALATLLGG